MAKILSFERRPTAGARTAASTELPAIVVIFPGVRYEKTVEAEAECQSRINEPDRGPSGAIQ